LTREPEQRRADSIFALSSGAGRAAVAVVRISGPESGEALKKLLNGKDLPEARRASLRRLFDPESGGPLDRALLLWLPGPASFTGEDMAEIQLHGGRAVVDSLLNALGGIEGLRPAEPGEFTRRAFDAGRLDLTEVEGLADLINAETSAQHRQALRQMEGGLERRLRPWREQLTRQLAYLEAAIDFSEEELPDDLLANQEQEVAALAADLRDALAQSGKAQRLREGIQIAIVGPPNAGKSSILNKIAGRDAAIVSERAGTTRDVVEVHLSLGGLPVTLADTAGLREAEAEEIDPVEREGMRRSRERAATADLVLAVFEATHWPDPDKAALALLGSRGAILLNKADLLPEGASPRDPEGRPLLLISAKSGQGLAELEAWLREEVSGELGDVLEAPGFSRLRHSRALSEAADALERFPLVEEVALKAEELRLALRALGRVSGRVDVEDLLDVIFADFCIGK
jgi:tRNA modification GTPase